MIRDPEWRTRLGLGALAAFVALGVAAFAVPAVFFGDARGGLSDHDVAVMKTEARHWSSVPPFALQITEAAPPAEAPGMPDGRVVWRTIFGLPYGETTFAAGQSTQEWRERPAAWAWGGFAAVEVVLLGGGLILLLRDP